MSTTKMEVIAVCAVKRFQRMIREYQGPPEGLKSHLLKQLNKMNARADELLAGVLDEIL